MSPLTCVSGYWNIKNKHGNKFYNWFSKSLKINCPYVFFCDASTKEKIKTYRGDLPTYYVECSIEDFVTYKYINIMNIEPVHCPSVELNLIWNEKIFMIKKAKELNPFLSDFFCWVDAGICIYRNVCPPIISFPNLEKLNKLPNDRFIYSSSMDYVEEKVTPTTKKHHLHHHVCGTSYILHTNIVDEFTSMYEKYMDELVDKHNIWTDQILWTYIFKENKEMFYKLCDGYGNIVQYMY